MQRIESKMDGGPALLPVRLKAAAFLLVFCNSLSIDAADPVPSDWRTGIATFYGRFMPLSTQFDGKHPIWIQLHLPAKLVNVLARSGERWLW